MQNKQKQSLKRLGGIVRKIPVIGFTIWWVYMLLTAPKKIFTLSAEKDRLERSNQELREKQIELENKLQQANQELRILIKELNNELRSLESKTNEQNSIFVNQLSSVTDIITKECIELGKLKIKNPDLKPIFIHSIFRSGSTYLWNKFRNSGNFWTYIEPFHQFMLDLEETGKKTLWGSTMKEHTSFLRHPLTDKNYFWEYPVINKGVPLFKKEFTFDYFCTKPDDIQEDMENYTYFLIGYAPKRAAFKFTRSALRSRWYKKRFDSVSIYLLRNPREQFESYQDYFKRGIPDFHIMSIMTIGKNQHRNKLFSKVSKTCGIPYYNSDNFKDEMDFYTRNVLPKLNTKDLYVLFYAIWLSALIENFSINDIFFNIDTISRSVIEKRNLTSAFQKFGIDLDLSDCSIRKYTTFALRAEEFEEVENMIYSLIDQFNIYDKIHLAKVNDYIKNTILLHVTEI